MFGMRPGYSKHRAARVVAPPQFEIAQVCGARGSCSTAPHRVLSTIRHRRCGACRMPTAIYADFPKPKSVV